MSKVNLNVAFSKGPDSDPFSPYATTNSTTFVRHYGNHGRDNADKTESEVLNAVVRSPTKRSGYTQNNIPFLGHENPQQRARTAPASTTYTRSLDSTLPISPSRKRNSLTNWVIDGDDADYTRESITKATFRKENTLHGETSGVFDSVQPRLPFPSGFATNVHGYKSVPHAGLRDEIPHPSVLRRMKTSEPIEAENNGRGPQPMSTTNMATYVPKSFHAAPAPQDYNSLMEATIQQRKRGPSAGYERNHAHSAIGPIGISELTQEQIPEDVIRCEPYKSTYTEKFSHIRTSKTREYDISDEPAKAFASTKLNSPKSDKPVNSTAYCKNSAEPILPSRSTREEQFPTYYMHPTVQHRMKIKDPVEYDTMQRRDPYATTNRATYSEDALVSRTAQQDAEIMQAQQDKNQQSAPASAVVNKLSGYSQYLKKEKQSGFACNVKPLQAQQQQLLDAFVDNSSDDSHNTTVYRSRFTNPNSVPLAPGMRQKSPMKNSGYTRSIGQIAASTKHGDATEDATVIHSETLQKVLSKRDPVQYGSAGPNHDHKRRA